MSVNSKRILSIIVYYTLAVMALLSAGFFVYTLAVRGVALWARIIYFIWAGLTIAAVIFDIICTSTGEAKTISGLIVYVLSVVMAIMGVVYYFVSAASSGLPVDIFNLYLTVALVSIATTGYMIATWVVGENLVTRSSQEIEIKSKKAN